MSLNKSVYTIKAVHSSSKTEKLSTDEFGRLQPVFTYFYFMGCKVGLCKEAMGEVKSLIHNLPVEALVKFDNCNGSTFYNTDLVLTCPVNLESCSVENCECQQMPLKITGL